MEELKKELDRLIEFYIGYSNLPSKLIYLKSLIPQDKPDPEGWIPHNGGECAVNYCDKVDIKYRDGLFSKDGGLRIKTGNKASHYIWKHNNLPSDIIAYRIIEDKCNHAGLWNGNNEKMVCSKCGVTLIERSAAGQFLKASDLVNSKGVIEDKPKDLNEVTITITGTYSNQIYAIYTHMQWDKKNLKLIGKIEDITEEKHKFIIAEKHGCVMQDAKGDFVTHGEHYRMSKESYEALIKPCPALQILKSWGESRDIGMEFDLSEAVNNLKGE